MKAKMIQVYAKCKHCKTEICLEVDVISKLELNKRCPVCRKRIKWRNI